MCCRDDIPYEQHLEVSNACLLLSPSFPQFLRHSLLPSLHRLPCLLPLPPAGGDTVWGAWCADPEGAKPPPTGPKDNGIPSPGDDDNKQTFYENLPFHGMQPPPNKVMDIHTTHKHRDIHTSLTDRRANKINRHTHNFYSPRILR